MNPFESAQTAAGRNGREVVTRIDELERAVRRLGEEPRTVPAAGRNGSAAAPADAGDLSARLSALERQLSAFLADRDTVRAPFRITGEAGHPVFEVTVQNGNPMLRFFNSRGQAVAEVRTVEDLDGGTAMLVLNDGRGRTCFYATASDDGGGLILVGSEAPDRLVLSGNRDAARGMIELYEASGYVRKRIDPFDLRLFVTDLGARLGRWWSSAALRLPGRRR